MTDIHNSITTLEKTTSVLQIQCIVDSGILTEIVTLGE